MIKEVIWQKLMMGDSIAARLRNENAWAQMKEEKNSRFDVWKRRIQDLMRLICI